MNATDVMDAVVTRLVEAIEAGADDWQMPWRTLGANGWPTNAATGNRYSGGNVLALYLSAIDRQYPTARWATYKQWQALGAQVRKGERGTLGIFWKVTDYQPEPADGDDATDEKTQHRQRSAWARAFTVFNAARVDNDLHPSQTVHVDPLERDARAEAFFAAIPAAVRWGSGQPCYRPHADDVVMPAFDAFHTAPDAYATLAHELIHWTGHPTRLARSYGQRFGDDAYTAEELVAELGAAFTCALVGIDTVARTDHAGYLVHWCQMLRAQPSILLTAAAKAQAAADWLAAYSTTPADALDLAPVTSAAVHVTVAYPRPERWLDLGAGS
jgi:antirestriction protein ArdC